MKKLIFVIILGVVLSVLIRTKDEPTVAQALIQPAYQNPINPYVRLGVASWYSKKSPGIRKTTANMEIFDDQDMTCAMWGVPFNQKVKVTNMLNGKSIVLRVNDRGPHQRFVRQGRIIDLTEAAFAKISTTKKGLIYVKVEFLRDSQPADS